MDMRPPYRWNLRTRSLQLGPRTLIMGVVNITPDSFSDGGRYFESERAIEGALRMLEEGADVLDLGGESTRPGTSVSADSDAKEQDFVSAGEELRRLLPVLRGILRARPDAILSVDTYKAAVARAAVTEGAEIVNDVSGLEWDREMAATCAELQCGVVLMHTRGTPKQWRKMPPEKEITARVEHDLANRLQVALERGIERQRIVIDPGFGFGKNYEENYPLLAHLDHLQNLRFPVLAGTSRKGFIGRTMGKSRAERTAGASPTLVPARNDGDLAPAAAIPSARGHEAAGDSVAPPSIRDTQEAASASPLRTVRNNDARLQNQQPVGKDAPADQRLHGSLAAMVASILRGAHIVRVHDVRPAVEAAAVADEVARAESA